MDVQFFTCVYEFHSVKGRKAGVRGVGWGQSCCVSLQRVNYCHDALLIFVYIFLMHCTEVAFAWLSNNYMGCEQTALPNERYMGIGGGNLFSFFFLFPSFLIKLNWCPNHPKLLCLNFPVLLDGYNNTDVFRNILGDSWGREECQLRNGHQHLYCCYYLYYLIYIMSWHLNVCSVKWSWMQSEVSRRENASIPVKKQFRHRSAQM